MSRQCQELSTDGPRGLEATLAEVASPAATVQVAVVAIWRHGERGIELLATRRPQGVHLAGIWEFPGGKIGPGESPRQAGLREVAEEVGLHPAELRPLITVEHAYSDRKVRIHAWLATVDRQAVAQNLQVAEHRWVTLAELGGLAWPEANGPILAAIVAHLNCVDAGAAPA